MALLIVKPETIRLIDEVCERTGLDPGSIVQTAMRERLAKLRTPEEEAERRAKIYETVKSLQAMFKEHPEAVVDIDELLYDENGLPK
jgi:hypothetical protein